MAKPVTKTEILKTIRKEISKIGILYDVDNRVSKIYTAAVDSVAGDYCLIKEFIYYPSSLVVKGRKEGYGLWLQIFDDAFITGDNLVDELNNELQDELGNQLIGA